MSRCYIRRSASGYVCPSGNVSMPDLTGQLGLRNFAGGSLVGRVCGRGQFNLIRGFAVCSLLIVRALFCVFGLWLMCVH